MKIFYMLLTVILTLSILIGCDRADVNDRPDETTDLSPTMELVTNGVCNYKITRPDNATSVELKAALDIANAISKHTNTEPEISTDFVKRGETYSYDGYEILIGRTAHSASKTAYNELSYGEYIVKNAGNKIIIAALNDRYIGSAANDFIKGVESKVKQSEEKTTITGDFNIKMTANYNGLVKLDTEVEILNGVV